MISIHPIIASRADISRKSDMPVVRYAFIRLFPYVLFMCRRRISARYRRFRIYNIDE